MRSRKPTSDDQTEKDEKALMITEIPLLYKRFRFCLFFIKIKTNLMPLNSSDGNENTTNQQYKDGHKYVAA